MIRSLLALSLVAAASGCTELTTGTARAPDAPASPSAAAQPAAGTEQRPDATASAEAAPARAVEAGRLGMTVASLGSPAEPGLWLKTPLVRTERRGRVTFAGSGKSVEVQLLPIGGAATSGSRMSLSAMQALGAPITGLPEIEVFAL